MTKRPTEEDFGLEPSADELATNVQQAPAPEVEEDEYRGDETDDPLQQVAPEVDTRPRDENGKFVKADTEGKRQPPPKGYVEYGALAEERATNKRLMEEQRIANERLTALLEAVEARNAPKVEEPAIPDRHTDPLGYIEHMEKRLAGIESGWNEQRQVSEASQREAQEMDQALNVALPQFEAALAEDPGLTNTYNGLLEGLAKEIAFVNRIPQGNLTPQHRAFLTQELTKVVNGHVKFAVQSGINVADYLREFAASRGVGGGAPAPQQEQVQQPAQQAQPQQRSIADRLASQTRHMSLSDANGTAAPGKIDAKALARMSQADFAKFAKSLGESGLDEVMGR